MYGTDHCVVQCIFVKTNIGALSTDTVDHGVLQWWTAGWQGLAGFRGPQQNPSELSESAYLQIFATKTSFFIIAGKQAICGWQKDLHTHRHVPSNTLFDVKIYMYFGYVLVVRKLSKSGLSNSSTKAGSLKALWKLSESSLKTLWKLYESSTKAIWKRALWKQADFCWKPFKSKLTFVENTPKVGWLL